MAEVQNQSAEQMIESGLSGSTAGGAGAKPGAGAAAIAAGAGTPSNAVETTAPGNNGQEGGKVEGGQERQEKPVEEGAGEGGQEKPETVTKADVQRMIQEAVEKDRQTRGAEDARMAYLVGEFRDMPSAFHEMIPTTNDRQKLAAAGRRVEEACREYVAGQVKRGLLRFVNVGGSGGGEGPGQFTGTKATPEQQIEAGLKRI